MPPSIYGRLSKAMRRGLGVAGKRLGRGMDKRNTSKETDRLEKLGLLGIGVNSADEDIADWEERLWVSQDDAIDELSREWRQLLHYVANRQHISWNRDSRRWVPKKSVPWRIRSCYNIMQKAVNVRVSRLTENKPSVSVIASSTDREDVEGAEYKETLFWHLWNTLNLHLKIVLARRWATKTCAGFIQTGFDPECGPEIPATKKFVRNKQVPKMQPVTDPATGAVIGEQPVLDQFQQPVMDTIYDGVQEFYVDADGQQLAPVEVVEDDPTNPGETRKVRQPPPENTAMLRDGEVYAQNWSAFNARWDRYVDDPAESWYYQIADIQPATNLVSLFPDQIEKIREAKPASEDDKAIQWAGLVSPGTYTDVGGPSIERTSAPRNDDRVLDKEYLVRQTWIFPKNRLTRELWGKHGALLVTVGGKLVHKVELPEWAREKCNLIPFWDTPEEANHYGKTILRDLLPLQDDINRTRSMIAERAAILSRIIFHAPQGHQMNLKLLGGLPGFLLTTRSREHKPEVLNMGSGDAGLSDFYNQTLAAATDLGNMNDATTGKLPSAGLAAKAIYALQYADERSIVEASNLQDISLKRLAESLDAIARVEYVEERKIKLVGADRSFMVERTITPAHLQADVDYFFVPGSMLSRQKEAIRNEMLTLKKEGLMEPWEVRKYISTAVPEAFRRSYDLQEAKAKRNIEKIVDGTVAQIAPDPWEDPNIGAAVCEEYMLTRKFEVLSVEERQAITMLWQAYRNAAAARMAQPTNTAPNGQGGAAGAQQPLPTGEKGMQPAKGAQQLEGEATAAMEPPEPQQSAA